MQVDRMCSTEAAIIIKENKQKQRGEHLFNKRVIDDRALSYNGAKTATRKHSFKSSAINGRAKGSKKQRTCRHADEERRKNEHLKLSTMPRTILFYENYKKINSKTLVKKISG